MPGAQLLGLHYPFDRLVRERGLDLRAAMSVDHIDICGPKPARRANDVLQKRLAGQRLKHFRQVGIHPLALARCQNDDRKMHADSVRGGFRSLPAGS